MTLQPIENDVAQMAFDFCWISPLYKLCGYASYPLLASLISDSEDQKPIAILLVEPSEKDLLTTSLSRGLGKAHNFPQLYRFATISLLGNS